MTYRNAGRKPKYNEPTTTIAFRIPESFKEKLRAYVQEQLKKYEISDVKHNKKID